MSIYFVLLFDINYVRLLKKICILTFVCCFNIKINLTDFPLLPHLIRSVGYELGNPVPSCYNMKHHNCDILWAKTGKF